MPTVPANAQVELAVTMVMIPEDSDHLPSLVENWLAAVSRDPVYVADYQALFGIEDNARSDAQRAIRVRVVSPPRGGGDPGIGAIQRVGVVRAVRAARALDTFTRDVLISNDPRFIARPRKREAVAPARKGSVRNEPVSAPCCR